VESYRILSVLRKGRVLTQAQFGCLGGIPTLNITHGCIFRCTYCYARGYSQAPKKGEVHLYTNLPRLLEEELSRKRVIPQWVILNTSSDCFQPHPDILQVTHELIRVLLDHEIGISFLTKGIIPQQFLYLFGRSPEKILAQIGLVSLSENYWKSYEPHTPSPEQRIENIQKLKKIGISPEIRIDPMIPFITDKEVEMTSLFERLNGLGVRRVTLSYLHLRPAIQQQLMKELSPLHRRIIDSCLEPRSGR
jgi:DNA repair photolyase